MPSNAMPVSQLIAHLQAVQEQHGDLDCVLALAADGVLVAIDTRLIGVTAELPWQRLSSPVVTFGMWADDVGRLTNRVGVKYQAEHAPGEWNYSRDAAPFHLEGDEPIILDVWRRDLKRTRDKGYRDAQGRWFVADGGERFWECPPNGVLAWKLPT